MAKDIEYLERRDFNKMADQSTKVSKLLNGLIKFCKKSTKISDTRY
ncbi:MAG TPA: hypothetical protein ENI19_02575 [Candidatus Nealsonbacteria bacterium]|nr:hypothetical protein [Candidatus Nealsonbacteria bacterium]HEB46573.1 hypothetical protein [Candidatus Nealsonbacteria bacterium]